MKGIITIILYSVVIMFFSCCRNESSTDTSITPTADTSITPTTDTSITPTYKVFLESSGSMFGFANGMSSFKVAIHKLLTEVESKGLSGTMSLEYINSKIIPSGCNDINCFVINLTPTGFRTRGLRNGGNINISDIRDMFEMVLAKTNRDDVSIFISDCDFVNNTPGGVQLLQSNMQSTFVKKLGGVKDLTTLVVYLDCPFTFRNKTSQKPYYIWIMGGQANVIKFMETVDIGSLKGYRGEYLIFGDIGNIKEPKLCPGRNRGSWELQPTTRQQPKQQMTIINAKPGDGAGFSIQVDLSKITPLTGDQYVLEAKSYSPIADYTISITQLTGNAHYTHKIDVKYVSNKPVRKQDIHIVLNRPIDSTPVWVQNVNATTNGTITKTCGILNMIDGIQEGYAINRNLKLFDIKVAIN